MNATLLCRWSVVPECPWTKSSLDAKCGPCIPCLLKTEMPMQPAKLSMKFLSGAVISTLVVIIAIERLPAQAAESSSSTSVPEPLNWTTQEDHQNMKDQLGIKRLRPGPSGRTGATNAANYDPARANPYPDLPDPLILKNGQKVTTAEMWWKQRRPEIVEDFEREVIGRVPKTVPSVTWSITTQATDRVVGELPVIAKQLSGRVDNSACPSITVDIQMTLVTPKEAKGPVPVVMMVGGFGG